MLTPIEPLSPFEVFRTPIIIRRFTQGFYLNGIWQEGSQVVLSTILIIGNVVNITLNGIALTPIPFTTNIATTMALIQTALEAQPNIQQVDISLDFLTITVIPLEPNLSFLSVFVVSGGVSQPTVSIANSPFLIQATASVQPIKGEEVMLIPEGRRDHEYFKMYTSTEIFGLTTQNPDQIQVLKSPFYPTVFEVVLIDPWENNSNFNIVNHYKYFCMKLQPLPGVL